MALFIAWISLGACLILTIACVLLFCDARGQRKAFGAAEQTIAALQARVAAQEAAIGRLTSAVGGFTPLALLEGDGAHASEEGPPAVSMLQRTTGRATPTIDVGPVPSTLRTGAPPMATNIAALCKTAEAQGMPAEHCNGRDCKSPRGCVCTCDACHRRQVFERVTENTHEALAPLVAAEQAALSVEDLASVDAIAEARGITRQEAIVRYLAARPAND